MWIYSSVAAVSRPLYLGRCESLAQCELVNLVETDWEFIGGLGMEASSSIRGIGKLLLDLIVRDPGNLIYR